MNGIDITKKAKSDGKNEAREPEKNKKKKI